MILKRFRGSIDPDKSGDCGGGRPLPQWAACALRLNNLEMISTRGSNPSSDSNAIVAVFVGAVLHHAPPAHRQANGCMVRVVPAGHTTHRDPSTPPRSAKASGRIDIQDDHGRGGGHGHVGNARRARLLDPNGCPLALPFSEIGWNAFSNCRRDRSNSTNCLQGQR
jgi:hypothetical protein